MAAGGQPIWEKTTTNKDGSVTTERRIAPPDWRADAWVLERRDPERWGQVNVSPPDPNKKPSGLPFDIVEVLERAAAKNGANGSPDTKHVIGAEPHDPRPLRPKT